MYAVVITPRLADQYLTQGAEMVTGFAVDARHAGFRDIPSLLKLFQVGSQGTPFDPSQPLNVLHIPADPFLQAAPAVSPLHPRAAFLGVVEIPPYDGTGVARAGDVETELAWLPPERLSAGTQLWRIMPDGSDPQLRGVYHGIAWGWEDVSTGQFVAAGPTPLMGPVVARDFGVAPVQVETENGTPVAVTMVTTSQPPEEGFEKLPSGVWAKRIAYSPSLDIFEVHYTARCNGMPVRIIRTGRDGTTDVAECQALICDAPYAERLGFQRVAPGTHMAVVKRSDLEAEETREGRVSDWSVENRPFYSVADPQRELTREGRLRDAFTAIASTAPAGWERFRMVAQIVGDTRYFGAEVTINGQTRAVSVLPVALLDYSTDIKRLTASEAGAPLGIDIMCTPNGEIRATADPEAEPPFSALITEESWRAEVAAYPRVAEPGWLGAAIAAQPGEK